MNPDHALMLGGIAVLFGLPIIIGVYNDWRRSPLKEEKE